MIRVLFALLICSTTLMPRAALADDFTAQELLDQCDGKSDVLQPFACWQYVDGVIEASSFTSSLLKQPPIFCLPEVYSRKMLRESVLAWLRSNEWALFLPAPAAVLAAMQRQYSCEGNTLPGSIPQ